MYKKMYIAFKFAPLEPGGSDFFALLFSSCFTLEQGGVFRPLRAQSIHKNQCLLQSIAYYMLTDLKIYTCI